MQPKWQLSIGRPKKSKDHPYKDLAKSGYKPYMMHKFLIMVLYLSLITGRKYCNLVILHIFPWLLEIENPKINIIFNLFGKISLVKRRLVQILWRLCSLVFQRSTSFVKVNEGVEPKKNWMNLEDWDNGWIKSVLDNGNFLHFHPIVQLSTPAEKVVLLGKIKQVRNWLHMGFKPCPSHSND
jgi:hypothetical protein